ncbi:hypothetical protein Hanom_Chr14g01314081 [Helianthus anomalus]
MSQPSGSMSYSPSIILFTNTINHQPKINIIKTHFNNIKNHQMFLIFFKFVEKQPISQHWRIVPRTTRVVVFSLVFGDT